MATRLELQSYLEFLAGPGWKVYFQPPENIQMSYPAILYERDLSATLFADNAPYRTEKRYQVTVIDRLPDSEVVDKIEAMPKSTFVRAFATSGLNHTILSLYF